MNQSAVTSSHIKLVFFDLDGTLTKTDTDWVWGLWRRRHFPFGFLEYLWLKRIFRQFHLGRLNPNAYLVYHYFRTHLLGPRRYRKLAEEFCKEHKAGLIRDEMQEILEFYRAAGIPIVMITAQNRVIAETFAREFGITELIANEYEQVSPTRYGSLKTPICFGEGKTVLAESFAAKSDISLEHCGFYSDSIHDLPLLSASGFQVVVNPDNQLKDHASELGWPVMQLSDYQSVSADTD